MKIYMFDLIWFDWFDKAAIFLLFLCIICTATPDISSLSENINNVATFLFLMTMVLIVTAVKSQLLKTNAKTKVYRNYNSFNVKFLKADLDENLTSNNAANCTAFQNTFITVLHVPIKKKKSSNLITVFSFKFEKIIYNKKGQM